MASSSAPSQLVSQFDKSKFTNPYYPAEVWKTPPNFGGRIPVSRDNRTPMQISFASCSKFLPDFAAALSDQSVQLDSGETIRLELESGGYAAATTITIHPHDRETFETEWESSDPTRFPARIKALATALMQARCYGRFSVSHNDGLVELRRE